MSTLRRHENPGPGYQRIACDRVELAIRCLTRQAGQALAAADAIQQVDAILALIEPDLPRQGARRDRAILARLHEGLTKMAKPAGMLEQLNRRYKKAPADADLASAVKKLRKRWSSRDQSAAAMSSKAGSFNPAIYRLVADMAELRGHMDHWPIEAVPADVLPRGLRRTYTKAQRLAHEPVTEDLLVALIRVLDELVTQLSVFKKICPVMLKAQAKLVSRVADALRDELQSDLLDQALRDALGKAASKALPKPTPPAKRLSPCVQEDLAAALAESPAGFIKRMQAYWSTWQQDAAGK